MLQEIINNFQEIKNIDKEIKKDIAKLRRLKTMIEIEKKNTKKTTLENNIIDLKQKYIKDLKDKNLTELIEQLGDKMYKLIIKNTKDFGGNDYEYLDIEEIKK